MSLDNINRYRESGGVISVGSEDEGQIDLVITVNGKMIVLKENAVYEIITADQIDPGRSTLEIPKMNQRLVIDLGTKTLIVSKTILAAHVLFQKGSFDNIKRETAISLSVEALDDFYLLKLEFDNLSREIQDEKTRYNFSNRTEETHIIPSIKSLHSKITTIFQKVDHIFQILVDIIRLYYPTDKKSQDTPFEQLSKHIADRYGESNQFSIYLNTMLEFFCHVRMLRNGLDHRLDFVEVSDFIIKHDFTIDDPSIALNHKNCRLSKRPLMPYLNNVFELLPIAFERILAVVAGDNISPSPLQFQIRYIPEEERVHQHVDYTLWSPIGDGGFYVKS